MQPDWQNDAAYEYTKALDREGWAWEFLRRNEEYKADWAKFVKKKAELEKIYGKITSWKTKAIEAEPKAWHYDPPKKRGESDAAWTMRCLQSDIAPDRTSIMVGPAKKWGLRQYYDPALPAGSDSKFLSHIDVRIWSHISDVEAPTPPADRGCIAYVELDLRKNLAKQIEIIKERINKLEGDFLRNGVLVKEKEQLSTPDIEKFELYIRILDAFEVKPDIERKVIAKKFFSYLQNADGIYDGVAKVYEKRKLARLWSKGYLKLIKT